MSQSSARRPMIDKLEARQLLSAAASNVVSVQFKGQTVSAIQDSYVVETKNAGAFAKAALKAGYADVESLGMSGFYSFTSTDGLARVQKWAKTHGGITSFQPNMTYEYDSLPNDPDLKYQYAIKNTGQTVPDSGVLPSNGNLDPFQAGKAGADLDLEKAWDITTGSRSVVVAVMDSGIDVNHPDLTANLWTNPSPTVGDVHGYNAADNNGDLTDLVGHGTAVSSAIGGVGNNGIGITGANWNVSIMMVKTAASDGSISTSAVISGYNYVVEQKLRGVDIASLNLSFGGQANEALLDPVEAAAIKRVTDAGVVVVTSAGNGGLDGVGDNNDYNPTSTQREAAFNPRAVVVAAVDNQDNLASFSNYGAASVTVGAPGVETLLAASSDATEDTANTTLSAIDPATGNPITNAVTGVAFGYIQADGTSFASPYTAGVIGLMQAAYEKYSGGVPATADQLVAALKQGARQTAQLDGQDSGGQKLVSTGGVVDAYQAIQVLLNRVAGTNAVTQGNWVGKYGSQGSFVYGATTGTPTLPFATSTLVPANSAVVPVTKAKDTDARLLQTPDATGRTDSFLQSATSLTFNFDFTTTDPTVATHRLTLYAASIDDAKRVQTVTVTDTQTGRVLQAATMTKFGTGQYVSLDLTGAVTITVSSAGNSGVVLNGIFLDDAPTVATAAVPTDATTKGSWVNAYGDLGYILPGTATSLPTFATLGTDGVTVAGKANALSPETPLSAKTKAGGTITTTGGGTLNATLNITDGTTRSVTFYVANATGKASSTRIEEIRGGSLIATADVPLSKSGTYVTFATSGSTTFRFTALVAGARPVLSGVFFNSASFGTTAANTATFNDVDTTTSGSWLGSYGVLDTSNSNVAQEPSDAGYWLAGGASTFTPAIGGGTTKVISAATKKKVALQNPAALTSGSRFLGSVFGASVSAVVDTGTTTPTLLTAYFVDDGNQHRIQRVDVIDTATGAVLSTQVLRDFANGKYLTYTVTGNVTLRVTRLGGPSAVINAIFKN